MSEKSYKLYYNNRPLKILFLLSDKDGIRKIKNIIEYNLTLWWWRFNQVIILKKSNNNIVIDDLNKKRIMDFDPDYIITSFKINNKFFKDIYNFISPILIEKSDFKRPYFSTSHNINPIHLYPYIKNLNIFNEFRNQPSLINLNISNTKNKNLINFIKLNFWNYEESMTYMSEIKESWRLKSYNINNYKALDDFISDYISNFTSKIFPIQISSQPSYTWKNNYSNYDDIFFVFLWNKIEEVSLMWNRNNYLNSWKQKYINQIYLNTEVFIKSKNILKLIKRLSNLNWSNPPRIIFFSKTYNKSKLEEIINNKMSTSWSRVNFEVIEEIPEYDFSFHNFYMVDKYKSITLNKNKDDILLNKPDVYPFNFWKWNYMSDLYIEYNPYKFNYTNITYWWQFPLKNHLANDITKWKKSRVLLNRNLSTLMDMAENSSSWIHWENYNSEFANLSLNLPENDYYFFRSVILWNDDIHTAYKWNFYDLDISTSWKKLLSTIQLFWSLFEAKYNLENKAWNNVFSEISNWKENTLFKDFINRIKKVLPLNELENINNTNYDEIIEKISSSTKKQLSEHNLSRREELRFKDIYKIISKSYWKYMKEVDIQQRVKEELHDFCSKNVFTIWLKPYCYKCNNQNWFSLKDLNSKLYCNYCNHEFILEPEQEWHYKLNDLVKKLYEWNWLYPVILTLWQLQEDSRKSFIYFWSLDIYKDEKNKITDLDIVCIQDGHLIIWEVKENSSLFKQKHFDEFLEFSKIINPDIVLFTALNKPTPLVKNQIKILNDKFKEYNLKTVAIWYQIREIIEIE